MNNTRPLDRPLGSLGVFQAPFPMFVAVLALVAAAITVFDRRFRNSELEVDP